MVIENATEQTKVFTEEGVEYNMHVGYNIVEEEDGEEKVDTDGKTKWFVYGKHKKKVLYRYILLPSKKDYVLTFKDSYKDSTKVEKVEAIATIDLGWFLLDLLNPVAMFVDFVTGNIYGYPDLKLK
jgi:hypothetical protein